MNKLLMAIAATFAFNSAQAATPSVSFILGADDFAEIYLATDDTSQGNFLGTSTYFDGLLQTITGSLTPGVTNYLHILNQNHGDSSFYAIGGEFTLSDSSFAFANGTQFLSTLSSTVNLSLTGFGMNYQTPGVFSLISELPSYYSEQFSQPNITEHIGGMYESVAYFSIPIYAVAAVPEPDAYAMLLAGLGLVGFSARRRKTS